MIDAVTKNRFYQSTPGTPVTPGVPPIASLSARVHAPSTDAITECAWIKALNTFIQNSVRGWRAPRCARSGPRFRGRGGAFGCGCRGEPPHWQRRPPDSPSSRLEPPAAAKARLPGLQAAPVPPTGSRIKTHDGDWAR